MLQGANTDLFNLLVSKAHNELQNPLFSLPIKPIKVNLKLNFIYIFYFYILQPRH